MQETLESLHQRIDELERALHQAKAGNLLEPLAVQLDLYLDVPTCRWCVADHKTHSGFGAALAEAILAHDYKMNNPRLPGE